MSARRSPTGTLHVVALPATAAPTLRDPGRLAPALLLASALERGLCHPGPVVAVGPGQDTLPAPLTLTARICPPVGEPRLGRSALARLARPCERIVCWSDELAPMARGLADEVHLVSTDPDACPSRPRHLSRITTLTERDSQRWRERGASPEPADWLARPEPPDPVRPALRTLPVDPGTLVVAALADRPRRTDARGLAFLLSVLHVTGYPVCGLAPSVAESAAAARRHLRGLGDPFRLLLTERPLTTLLDQIDVAVMPEESDCAASLALQAAAEAQGCRVVRLSRRGRAGLKSTPGAVAPVLEAFDAALAARAAARRPTEPAHA